MGTIQFDQEIHEILERIEVGFWCEIGEFDRLLAETGLPLLTDWEYELLATAPARVEPEPIVRITRRGWRRVIGFRS